MSILSEKITKILGFDPGNEKEILELVRSGEFPITDIIHIFNPTEEIQLLAIRWFPPAIKYIRNPTLNVQLEAIRLSGYDLNVIIYCPDYKNFEQEILDNLTIKDIIQ